MFQLYRSSQFYWWRKQQYTEKPTNLPQYPKEIADRRRVLVPKLKQYKRQGRQAKIVDDRHIVDDVHFPGGDPPRREEQAMDNYWQDNTSDRCLLANKITVTYLNVCGLRSKLLIPEFLDLIKLYDIIFFCEAKLDSYDVFGLPEGYSFATKNRKKMQENQVALLYILP